jgi:glycosyltransferase involved in cell wall biosynthesis
MRVLQILEACGGGTRKHVRYLCEGLRAAGDEVDLVYSPHRADADFDADLLAYKALGVQTHMISMQRGPAWSDRQALCELRSLIRLRSPQLVHAHCTKAGLLARLAGCGVRTVYTPHAFFFQAWSGWKRQVGMTYERVLGRRTDRLLAISASERDLAAQLLPESKICEVRNGIPALELDDREALRARLGLSGIVIGMAARLAPQKGHRYLLQAMTELPDVTLMLWGDGPLREELEQLACELRIADRVRFLGHQPQAERQLSALDIAVLPSLYEGLSYQLLESLGAGLPLIASDVPGNRLAEPENPIVYVPLRSSQPLAKAIQELAADPNRRHQLGAAGQDLVRTRYSLEQQLAAIREAYSCESSSGERP